MLQLTWDMLREAIATYIQFAYPSGQLPDVVRQRIALDADRPILDVVRAAPFENYTAKAPFPCTVHALRLGSDDYPHLKMEIRPFPNSAGFVFWVNTHDQFVAPNDKMLDADRWRRVVQRNRDLKQNVERAWADKKLPTFTTSMQEGL